MRSVVGFLFCLFLLSAPVAAQTPVANPTTLEFRASTDHNATAPVSGAAIVTRYEARYYPAASCNPTCPTTTPAFTLNLNKPAPVAGKIVVTNVFQGLTLNTLYKAVTVAVGPGGVSANSNVSDPFGNETLAAPAPPSETVVKGS